MKTPFISLSPLAAFFGFFSYSLPAWAQSGENAGYEGMAKPWQMGFQPAATPVMEKLHGMHDLLNITISLIVLVVLVLMVYIAIRFRRKANPVPSKTTHHTLLEIIWTTIPILILVAIAIPSLRNHYYMQKVVEPEMTIKAVGNQWFWHYEYPDHGGFGFDSYMIKDAELKEGEHRLLSVDNSVVVPVDTTIRVLITSSDVIHAWAVPAFGVKRDGIPGRLNESWFKATKIGRFYGQCSELCGVGHGFMPIVVDVVSKEDFASWVASKRPANTQTPPTTTPNTPGEAMKKATSEPAKKSKTKSAE